MEKKLLAVIVIVQILVIGLVGYRLLQKKNVLGTYSVSVMRKTDVVFSADDNLKHFYEPKPNSNDPYIKPPYFPYKATYTINADSLNDRYNYSVKKPPGTCRIITLGDSFTYGLYVDTKDNWTELLEDKLHSEMKCSNIKKFEVINLGVWGYDKEYAVERFKRRGEKYNPDLVIWMDVYFKRMSEATNKFLEEYSKNPEFKKQVDQESKKDEGFDPWKKALEQVNKEMTPSQIMDFQGRAMKRLDDYYRGDLIYIPIKRFFSPEELAFAKNIIDKRPKGYFFDGLRNFYNEGGAINGDEHPNQKGHGMIAEDVYNYLISNNFMNCK